jgi:phosphoribosylanthranilate isomerase
MPLWIKICGLTTEDAVQAAVSAGADAIGFVFAPSKRQVSPKRAAELVRGISDRMVRVAVMQHSAQSLLDEVWEVFRPHVLQTDAEDLERLEIPEELTVMPVVRSDRPVPASLPERVLFEGSVSGAGERADWATAARLARSTQLVLAGGLDANNVGEALAAVRPFGVDVSSGVEATPGIKDASKIFQFVRRAREAADGVMR